MKRYKVMVYNRKSPIPVVSLIESRTLAISYARKEAEKNNFVVVMDEKDKMIYQESKDG